MTIDQPRLEIMKSMQNYTYKNVLEEKVLNFLSEFG